MLRKVYSGEQIAAILKESEAGVSTLDLCRKYGMSQNTFYKWKQKFGGMEVSDIRRLRCLEDENGFAANLAALDFAEGRDAQA